MRDILLMAIVVALLLVTLRRPWVGVLLWVWISLMNPHRFTYGFAYDAPLAALAAATTLLAVLFTRERDSPFKGLPATLFAVMTVWITISWLLGLDVSGDQEQWEKVMKINLMLLLALVLLRSKEHIFALVWVVTLSIALLGTKGGLFTVMNAGSYRVLGPEGSFIGGNNEFAVAVVMTIPLLRFMQLQATRTWLKRTLLAMMMLCAAAALGSHSRGALLAVVAMSVVLWWRGRNRFWNGLGMLAFGALLLNFMPDTWTERMETIETYDEDASARGRFSAWWVSWRLAFKYPFGVGFNISRTDLFAQFSPYPELGTPVAHSIYFQMLGHHGFVGFLLFVAIWVSSWLMASSIRRRARNVPQAHWCIDMAGMCQVSLVGYLVGGAFLQLGYYDFPYYVMALIVLTHAWLARRGWEKEPSSVRGWRALIGIGAAGDSRSPATGAGPARPVPASRR